MSFCSAIFAFGFAVLLNLPSLHFFVFFSTFFVYTGHRIYKIRFLGQKIGSKRIDWMRQNPISVNFLLFIAALGFAFFAYPLFKSSTFNSIILLVASIVAILYVVRVGKRNLREIPFVKIFLVSGVYYLITCVLPFQDVNLLSTFIRNDFCLDQPFLFTNLVYLFAITILFDIPDLELDEKSQKTLAQFFGVKVSFIFSVFLVTATLVIYALSNLNTILVFIFGAVHLVFYWCFWQFKKAEFFLPFFGEMLLLFMGVLFFLIKMF